MVLYLNDDTTEIVLNDFDFQRMLYDRLGADVEEYFAGVVEEYEFQLEQLRKENEYNESCFEYNEKCFEEEKEKLMGKIELLEDDLFERQCEIDELKDYYENYYRR